MSGFTIDSPRAQVQEQWMSLWRDYNKDHPIPEDVSLAVWDNLLDQSCQTFGLFAYDGDTLVGFLLYVLHNTTSSKRQRCYLEDGYIAPDYRGKGLILMLYKKLQQIALEKDWQKIYWITRPTNIAARIISRHAAEKTDWVRYEDNLG